MTLLARRRSRQRSASLLAAAVMAGSIVASCQPARDATPTSPAETQAEADFFVVAPSSQTEMRPRDTYTVGGGTWPGTTVTCWFTGGPRAQAIADASGTWEMHVEVADRGPVRLTCGTPGAPDLVFEYTVR